MLNLNHLANTILILLISTFESGSYKVAPILFLIYPILVFKNKILINKKILFHGLIYFVFIITIFSRYNSSYSDIPMSRALLTWSLLIPIHFFIIKTKNLDKSLALVFKIIIVVALLDYVLFFLYKVDLSSIFLGIQSRHISQHVGIGNLPRSTGLFGEPGTQANAILIIFLLIKNKTRNIKFFYVLVTIITLSPYLLIGFYYFISRKNIIKFIVITIPIFMIIFYDRVVRIINFEDGSFLERVKALDYFYENYMYLNYLFSSDVLFTDAGLWLELMVEYGYFPLMIFLIFILKNKIPSIILLLKIKAYSGWPILFMFFKKK